MAQETAPAPILPLPQALPEPPGDTAAGVGAIEAGPLLPPAEAAGSGAAVTQEPLPPVEVEPVAEPDGRFAACPDALLKAAWATVLTQTALETFAVEQEVLRLCEKRAALINKILRHDAELALLMAVRPAAVAPVRPAAVVPVPVSPAPVSSAPASAATDAVPPEPAMPEPPASVAGNGADSGVAVAAVAGRWTRLVRYRVRAGDGAWRAAIASTWNPPPPLVELDDGSIVPGDTPPADPPIMTIVAAGDVLPGGLVIAQIGEREVLVRDPRAADTWALRNDPGSAGPADASCPTGAADARDLVHCRVER